jgi:hypothetical protein
VIGQIRQNGVTAAAVVGDLAVEDGAGAVAEASAFGGIDILIKKRRRTVGDRIQSCSRYTYRDGPPPPNGRCLLPGI